MVNISTELDKTNRISPITVTINPAGGICNKTSFSAYPGYNLKMPEIKKDKMFLNGWKDSQGNFVQKVPASDILLTAEWSDRLDLTKFGVENTVDGNLYHINGNIHYQYPDAVLFGGWVDENNIPVMRKGSSIFYSTTSDEEFTIFTIYLYEYNQNKELIDISYWYVTNPGYTLEGVYLDEVLSNLCSDSLETALR